MKLIGILSCISLLSSLLLSTGCPLKPPPNTRHPAPSSTTTAKPAQPPASQPVAIPDDVREALPVDSSFTPLEYSDSGGEVHIKARSAWDTERTSEWLLTEMERRGYTSEDNPSQILDGLTFTNPQAKYASVVIKATMDASKQCTVEITAK